MNFNYGTALSRNEMKNILGGKLPGDSACSATANCTGCKQAKCTGKTTCTGTDDVGVVCDGYTVSCKKYGQEGCI